MNRNGSALFVALLVVLIGAMVSVLATRIAATGVRAGTAWRDQQVATSLATSALARSRERAESTFDSVAVGTSIAIDDTISLWKLGDSLAVITAASQFRSGLEVNSALVRARQDSLGGSRLTVPGARSRFHPIP